MSYTEFKDGYLKETTQNESLIVEATQTYLWGAISQESLHPSPTTVAISRAPGVSVKEVPAGNIWKGVMDCRGMYGMCMQNGVILWATLGKSSTAGAGPYVHTITPTTDGSKIPSFTIHSERTRGGTDWAIQYTGCFVDTLTLYHDLAQDSNFLMARIDWLAMKALDPDLSGTNAMLTNDPILAPTATSGAYTDLTLTWDYGGTPLAIDGLKEIEITIHNGLFPVYAHTWDTGVYTGQWPHDVLESPEKQYQVTFKYHPVTIEAAIWDELVASSNTKDLRLKWTKSADDYIILDFADCQVLQHTDKVPAAGDLLLDEVTLKPRALSVSVSDSIAGGYYGE